mgnify:CR=1 FL=1
MISLTASWYPTHSKGMPDTSVRRTRCCKSMTFLIRSVLCKLLCNPTYSLRYIVFCRQSQAKFEAGFGFVNMCFTTLGELAGRRRCHKRMV